MKTKLFSIVAAFTFSLLTTGCGKETEHSKTGAPATEIQNVAITKVTKSAIDDFYEATGTVKAKTTTNVSANMMGRIIAFPVAEGDFVSRGQMLAEIDGRESRAQNQKARAGLQEAQASLIEIDRSVDAANAAVRTAESNKALAEKTFERFRELYERKSASGQEYDEAQQRLKAASSELDRARANVQTILSKKKQINARIEQVRADITSTEIAESYSRIVSPVSGVIVKKLAESGATATPGQPLLSIEDSSQYRLEAAVEETRSKSIRIGSRVNVMIDALGQTEFYGAISEIVPSADAASRSIIVKIDLPANPMLRSGLYGLARFPVTQKETISVPQTAIVTRGQLSGVFVVAADGTVQFRIVTTGKTADAMVEILTGVSEGDEIAASDVARLTDGVKVR